MLFMGRKVIYTGVRLGCILRCIYNNGGQDGQAQHINLAASIARNHPASLDPDVLGLIATEEVGYFYAHDEKLFDEFKDRLWKRLGACVVGLPPTAPAWFSMRSRLIDIMPEEFEENEELKSKKAALGGF